MTIKQEKKTRDSKFRVRPNQTPKGKDIMMRLRNRSLNISGGDNYTDDEELVNARKLDRVDLINKARANAEKITGLKQKAEHLGKEIEKQKNQSKPDPKPDPKPEPKDDKQS